MVERASRVFAGFILVLALWQMGILLVSSTIARQVETTLQQLKQVTDADRQMAQRSLAQAMSLDAGNPGTLRLAAHLRKPGPEKLALLSQLAEVRPRDGQVWADIFALRLEGSGAGKETADALILALDNGPWEPAVLFTVVEAGTRYWLVLESSARALVMEAAQRSLLHSAHYRRDMTRRILTERGFLSVACRGMDGEVPGVCDAKR